VSAAEDFCSGQFTPRGMNRTLLVGAVLLVAGLAVYAPGVVRPFPGRAFSITAVMVGLLLVAVGRAGAGGTVA
jgi:hypothetical protein